MVCGSFICIYRDDCIAYEVQGTDAFYGAPCNGNDECVNFICEACTDIHCKKFSLPEADDYEVSL